MGVVHSAGCLVVRYEGRRKNLLYKVCFGYLLFGNYSFRQFANHARMVGMLFIARCTTGGTGFWNYLASVGLIASSFELFL